MNNEVAIFGINIDDCEMGYAINRLEHAHGFNFVVTPNIQQIILLDKNKVLQDCYKNAAMVLCDSRIIQLLASFCGVAIKNVIPGSDLTRYYFENSFKGDESIMVIGSSDDDIDKLRTTYALRNLSYYIPPMGFINDQIEVEKIVNSILSVRPKYLFLAVGFPRQEILSCRLKREVDFDCVAFCIGASIDFLTGKQKRAPEIWQRLRLEWLYRFVHEPKRLFRRYFVDSWGLIPIFLREYVSRIRN